MKIFNTLSKRKETFVPQDPDRVTMYVCGPTVYNYAHIGNARPAVVFDTLRRLLRHHYPNVIYARNITDVDDKIMKAAEESGEPIAAITQRFTQIYHEDTAALGVLPPDIEPRATEHIDPMIGMIQTLVDSGNAYVAEGHVLFSVESFSDYGELSRRSLEDMQAGARVEVADYKRHPADFVLWKPSTDEQIGWDSPWGRGRPGWHLECSVMAAEHLGKVIDIHGGGIDLVFPHHENELAQSRCAHGNDSLARYWMHNGFLTIDEDKMSKSLNNFLTINELLKTWPGEALRLTLLSAHYRQPLDWSEKGVEQSISTLDRVYRALNRLKDVETEACPPDDLVAALDDDLNTPAAMSVVAQWVNRANTAESNVDKKAARSALLGAGNLLGLFQADPQEWLKRGAGEIDAAWVDEQLKKRNAARTARDFATADAIRDKLSSLGIVIEDGPDGAAWRMDR